MGVTVCLEGLPLPVAARRDCHVYLETMQEADFHCGGVGLFTWIRDLDISEMLPYLRHFVYSRVPVELSLPQWTCSASALRDAQLPDVHQFFLMTTKLSGVNFGAISVDETFLNFQQQMAEVDAFQIHLTVTLLQ